MMAATLALALAPLLMGSHRYPLRPLAAAGPPTPPSAAAAGCTADWATTSDPAVAACCRTMVAGWGTLGTTLKEARKIRNTWRFLLIYFVYSDGYGTISSVGVLYALEPVNILQNTFSDRTRCIAQLRGRMLIPAERSAVP